MAPTSTTTTAPSAADIKEYYARIGADIRLKNKPTLHDAAGAWYKKLADEYESQNTAASMLQVAAVTFVITFVLMMVLYHTCCVSLKKNRRRSTMLNARCKRMLDVEKLHDGVESSVIRDAHPEDYV